MKRALILSPIFVALATLALGAQALHAQANPKDEVAAVVAKFAEAFRVADAAALDALLGPDYIHTNTGGGVVNREQWLAYIASRRGELDSGVLVLTRYENRDVDIRIHDDTAVVTGHLRMDAVVDGKPRLLNSRYTDVWIKGAKGWQMVAWQSTRMPA